VCVIVFFTFSMNTHCSNIRNDLFNLNCQVGVQLPPPLMRFVPLKMWTTILWIECWDVNQEGFVCHNRAATVPEGAGRQGGEALGGCSREGGRATSRQGGACVRIITNDGPSPTFPN
jgi:hypothetical protein